jgi:hypothetical protein
MPMQRSRTRAVIPGKAILGVAGADKAQKATMGGAVVPGKRILGDRAAREQENARLARLGEAAADPKAATGPASKTAAPSSLDESMPPGRQPKKSAKLPSKNPPSLSEGEAVAELEADPNSWERILDLEAERADGMRPAIAAAIVRVADRATTHPVDPDALTALHAIAAQAAE